MSNILFLQGPLGPFFSKLAEKLSLLGNTTFKINFNGGDAFFSGAQYEYNYTGSFRVWSRYLSMFVRRNDIHAIVVYGDCRHYHSIAKDICVKFGIEFWVFEEGYIRPNYITLEKGGVNAHSKFKILGKSHAESLARYNTRDFDKEFTFGATFTQRLGFGVSYYFGKLISKRWLKNEAHHRSYTVLEEMRYWLNSIKRKWLYKITQFRMDRKIVERWQNNYFFVPLQVHCDSQILSHSDYQDVNDFIREVMISFCRHAPKDTALVFKHHPMDSGFRHYGKLICRMAKTLGISDRVEYGHELHLPTMLKHCRGTITINSTVGLSSLHHSRPTKVMGKANYDIPGLTSTLPLESFWTSPCSVDESFFSAYKESLKRHTQINGNFYKNIDLTCDNIVEALKDWNIRIEANYRHLDDTVLSEENPLEIS